ncbi:hypothetical protein QE152_g26810 [Popillia japonica]|uniref:Uncharacterized protein n=1 Tax=Popillia japonica TaxID=7064 RepID=A0AAW1JVP7_POPJA
MKKGVTIKLAGEYFCKFDTCTVQQGSTLKSKRYSSFSGDSQKELDNVNIEEIDSDKDVLSIDQINKIQLLEEKCLNSIEVMLQDKENNNSENGKTKRRRRYKKQEENNQIKGVDPGWNRIQKMNKSLNKTNREMKKLRYRQSVLAMRETKSDENSKSYNLREVESYIENNINTFENHEDSNSIRPGTSDRNAATTVASNKAELRPNQIIKDSQDINKSYEAACNSSEDSRSIHDKKQIAHSGSIFSQNSKMDKVERELQAMFSSPETENQKSNVDNNNAIVNDINEISTVLDQLGKSIISFTDCLQDNIDVDIAKFSIDKLKLLLNNLKSKHNSQNVAPEYTKNVFITQPISLDTRSIAIQTNDFPSSGFKISSTADFKTLEKCNAEIQTDEISDEKYLKKLLKMSQDDTYLHSYVKTKSIAIQTEKSKSPKFECKSSKQSIAIQVEMVTNQDPVYIASDTSVSSRTPSDILVNNDEITDYCRDNFQFAESLDCVNFDTQAALQANKQKMETKADVNNAKYNTQSTRPIRKKLSFDTKQHFQDVVDTCSDSDVEIIENENTLVSKEDNVYVEEELKLQKDVITSAPNSTILFSLTQKDNAMNNTMINRFKRVRALMEDYDDGVIKKLKKQENPYLMPQLSVEFISQAPENVNEAQKELVIQNDTSQSIQISQSLNYDEYLDRIMEKYDENNIKTSTPKKEPVPKSRQTKSQYIINKCDALIQEAAVSPPVSPPKKKLCKEYDITTQDLEEFKLPFNEIISEPENFHKMAHKKTENHTESIFCRYGTNTQTTVLVDMPFSNMESLAEEFSKELQPMSAKSKMASILRNCNII